MLAEWPAWKRILTSTLFCLCIAVLIVTAPLAELPERAAGLPGPALVVVGDVVALREPGTRAAASGDSGRAHVPV